MLLIKWLVSVSFGIKLLLKYNELFDKELLIYIFQSREK